jgi:CheY-like chemotaxis protein
MGGAVNLEGKSILVVEDDNMNFIYLQQIFKITKGKIVRAIKGQEALDLVKENDFDLILMDIQLPDIMGTEVTRQIRSLDASTPIIAQTASRAPEETDQCMKAGCSDVMIKPFTLNDFSRIVRKHMSGV